MTNKKGSTQPRVQAIPIETLVASINPLETIRVENPAWTAATFRKKIAALGSAERKFIQRLWFANAHAGDLREDLALKTDEDVHALAESTRRQLRKMKCNPQEFFHSEYAVINGTLVTDYSVTATAHHLCPSRRWDRMKVDTR